MSAAVKPAEWKTADVGLWLRSLDSKFDRYTKAFEAAGVDGPILLFDVSEPDLKEWIPIHSHRTQIKCAIDKLRSAERISGVSAQLSSVMSSACSGGGSRVQTRIVADAGGESGMDMSALGTALSSAIAKNVSGPITVKVHTVNVGAIGGQSAIQLNVYGEYGEYRKPIDAATRKGLKHETVVVAPRTLPAPNAQRLLGRGYKTRCYGVGFSFTTLVGVCLCRETEGRSCCTQHNCGFRE